MEIIVMQATRRLARRVGHDRGSVLTGLGAAVLVLLPIILAACGGSGTPAY